MTAAENFRTLKKQMSQMRIKGDELQKKRIWLRRTAKTAEVACSCCNPVSRRIFDKLWAVGKGHSDNQSFETFGSSQSPTSLVPGDTNRQLQLSRHKRHSIS
ncbi:hypothetical protein SLA2020_269490 [Shorea laevis]